MLESTRGSMRWLVFRLICDWNRDVGRRVTNIPPLPPRPRNGFSWYRTSSP